jgi:hypothetical protein
MLKVMSRTLQDRQLTKQNSQADRNLILMVTCYQTSFARKASNAVFVDSDRHQVGARNATSCCMQSEIQFVLHRTFLVSCSTRRAGYYLTLACKARLCATVLVICLHKPMQMHFASLWIANI